MRVVLAQPRGFCAGVERAIEIVERAIEKYGPPIGLDKLADVAHELAPFPVLALGGISIANAEECLRSGASGIAGISLFNQSENLEAVVAEIKNSGKGAEG